jgi:hypothetical protein
LGLPFVFAFAFKVLGFGGWVKWVKGAGKSRGAGVRSLVPFPGSGRFLPGLGEHCSKFT